MIKHIIFDWQGVLSQIKSKEIFNWIVENEDKYNYSILSNYPGGIKGALKSRGVEGLFQAIITPKTTNYHKPNTKAFQILLDQITNKKEEVLFVDDSLTNVKAAREIGFKSIHFKSNESFFKAIKKYE